MDYITFLKSIVMGVVEGTTEFLPVSSTGHLILAGDLLNFLDRDQRGTYEIFIQLGAMLAVAWEYRVRLMRTVLGAYNPGVERRLLLGVFLAFVPSAVAGLILGQAIKGYLFAPIPVALAFIIGGMIILWAERRAHTVTVRELDEVSIGKAFLIGLMQCLALVPGTSRSGATIIGGLFLGLSRKASTEFSFILGIPTLGAASLYSLYKVHNELYVADIGTFAVGFVAAFISAFVAIRALLRFISRHTFEGFAWYRIVFGLLVLLTAWTGFVRWST